MRKFYFTIILIFSLFLNGYSQEKSKVILTEKMVSLPTYPVAPNDKNPIFFRNENHQGASRHVYPLKLGDQYTNERIIQEWKTIILENEYIEIGVTPDIGGKLYYATDKTNNYHFIYKNDVVKPSNISQAGAWVSGGIEWCVLHHHRASTFQPFDYTTTENSDGSKTIWVAEHEPRHGMRWTVGITIFPGKSYFKAETRIHNSSQFTHTFLNWANVAVHVNKDYQTIFPPSAQIVKFHSVTDVTQWPNAHNVFRGEKFDGIDISWWENVLTSNSFFIHDLQEDFMGGYDHKKNSGTVHFGNHHITKGAKLWEWGSGPSGQATEGVLTENSGPYAELMVGTFSDNQPDYSWIRPYEVKQWEQYWFPVRGIEGFKNANLNGAVNLEPRNEKNRYNVFLGYYSTSKIENAKVILKNIDEILFEKSISISPEKPFAETIRLNGPYNLTELYTQLINTKTGEILIDYQHIDSQPIASEDLPEPWGGYSTVDKLETVEELYLTGSRIEQFYAPRHNPMDWYKAVLAKDPGDIRTNVAVGNIYLKSGEYILARKYLGKAIKRLTNDYTVPSTHEAFYLQGLALRGLELLSEAEDTLYRATWDYAYHSAAYYQLAELSCIRNNFAKALHQISESLWTNGRNNNAIALKASIQRKVGDFDGALATLAIISKDDPLDFRIRNEYYLIAKESGDNQKANSLLISLDKEMRDFDDNYLELAVGYIKNGLLVEAEEVLKRFNGENPFFDYYLGYLSDIHGNNDKALQYFKSAGEKSVDYVFPYRLESVNVLKTAIKYNPTDGKAFYYLGNILYEKQPDAAITYWGNAIELNPDLAIAHRNLGWGYFYHFNDVSQAIIHYEKAISVNKNEALYYTELSELYERNNTPVETRVKLFEGRDDVVKNRDDSYMYFIENLILSKQADKAVEALEGANFAYTEGSSRARNTRINAYLTLGKQYFDNQEYQKALDTFLRAQITRQEAGDNRLGGREIEVEYYIGLAYEALQNRTKAKTSFKKSVQQHIHTVNVTSYYQGLSYAKLGDKSQAKIIFETMVSEADQQMEQSIDSEVGTIFGRREASDNRLSRLYTLRGLGYKGLGELQKAKDDLNRALEFSQSNLTAIVEKL